ncbi:hypothetical protein ABT341_21445, partial [Pseudonocardia alni]
SPPQNLQYSGPGEDAPITAAQRKEAGVDAKPTAPAPGGSAPGRPGETGGGAPEKPGPAA